MEIKDMTINDIEARAKEIREAMKTEDADLDALTSEVDALEVRKAEIRAEVEARAKEAEKVANGLIGKVKEEHKEKEKMTNMEIRNTQQYIDAFANYCKTGDDKECRALLTENVSGVIPVPEFVGEIIAKRLESSKILSRVRKMEAAGNVKVSFEYGAPAAEAHTEGDEAIAEEELLLGIVTLVPTTWKKWVGISDEALDTMEGRAYLEYIYDEIARGIVKARENAVVAAILAAPQTATASAPSVPKTGTAAGNIADFVNARALLSSAAEDLVILCTPAQYAQYRALQMAANYGVDPFDGLEVLFNDTVTAPIIGDLYGVLENLPRGENVQIKYDDKTRMKEDIVEVLGRLPSAIEVVGDKYFAKVSA